MIRDHLDVGRPDQVALVFDRRVTRRTPGGFRTRVITKGVEPILSITYKSSRLKQYFKENRALRTETVICDTRDFGIGRGSVPRTGMPYGLLATTRTGVCATPRQQTHPRPPMWPPLSR